MLHDAPRMSVDEAVRRISADQSLDGHAIDLESVLERLVVDDTRLSIRHAVLSACRVPTSFSGTLFVRHCVLMGTVRVVDCERLRMLVLDQSSVEEDVEIRRSGRRSGLLLTLTGTTFEGDFTLDGNDLGRAPDVARTTFLRGCQFSGNESSAHADVAPQWLFDQCRFEARLRFEESTPGTRLKFFRCQFDVGLHAQLSVKDGFHTLSFVESSVLGKVRVLGDGPPCQLDFSLSFVLGEFDLRGLKAIESLNLFRTTISGGRLIVSADRLRRPRTWPGQCELDCESVLVSESNDRRATTGPRDESAERVSREFEELRNAFAATPATDDEEDYCHYKSMDYMWLRRARASLGQLQERGTSLTILTIFLTALAVLYTLRVPAPSLRVPAVLASLWLLAVIVLFGKRAPSAIWLHGQRTLFKHVLGWGVRVRRVLVSGAVAIVMFAVLYACLIRYGFGDIRESGDVSILEVRTEGLEKSPRTGFDAFLRLLYFSGVTFTTLGYGDYHPTKWVQIVAVGEALLGALTIAVVTVLFARKFMQR